ncbi:hypothetical protein HMPREF9374_3082 [Desmospora sp. 8437]|nr:hypothetical protein HMPREF9374_3082 [Desmospora sp. 8437]
MPVVPSGRRYSLKELFADESSAKESEHDKMKSNHLIKMLGIGTAQGIICNYLQERGL